MYVLNARGRTCLWIVSGVSYLVAGFSAAATLEARPGRSFSGSDAVRIVPPLTPVLRIIRRDPFAHAPETQAGASRLTPVAGVTNDKEAQVPDLLASTFEQSPPTAQKLVLKATLTGSHPVAYVEVGNDLEIVRPGDMLAGHRVIAIELSGLAFAGGSRLQLITGTAHKGNSGPPRARAARATASVPGQTRRDESAANPPYTPAPIPASSAPTPGPAPTIKPGPFPRGIAPTPNLTAPTAFPYPYPYAPH